MRENIQAINDESEKKDTLSKLEVLKIYMAIKNANPKIKGDINKLRKELTNGLSRHDRASGIWLINIFKKVVENRSKNISVETLEAAYKTNDKDVISRKLIAYYSNYAIAVGAILGSSGGILGFVTAAYATFGEIVCLTYFELCLIYDLSALYEKPLDKVSYLEIYRLFKMAFNLNEQDLVNDKVDELVDRGVRHIEDKLLKDDSQKLFYGLLKNLGAVIIRKTVKNFIAKIIPLVGAVSGTIICTAEDYRKMRCLGRRTARFYRD